MTFFQDKELNWSLQSHKLEWNLFIISYSFEQVYSLIFFYWNLYTFSSVLNFNLLNLIVFLNLKNSYSNLKSKLFFKNLKVWSPFKIKQNNRIL